MMIRQSIQRRTTITLGIASVVLLLGFYTFLSYRQHKENPQDSTIPTWRQLGHGIATIVTEHPRSGERWLWIDAKATVIRLFVGLGIGVLIAVILGMLMGCFAVCEAFFLPSLSLLAKVPPTAILAVFFVLVGTDLNMYIAMISFGVIPALAMSIQLSVKEVPNELIYKAYTLGASHSEVGWNIIFRHVLPNIIDSMRMFIGPAMVYLIAAEMLCADEGMGYRIRLQSRLLRMEVVYPYLAMLAAFGFGMDYSLRRLQAWMCPWFLIKK
jgi:NitT/TauT family transport system permease protein